MALYDIMDEIAEKQLLKTETGDNRIFGVMLGVVVSNYNKDLPGRVCVSIPVRDKEANVLKWARVVTRAGGKKWGIHYIPEVGDQVMIAFEQGNIEKPFVIGSVPMDNDRFMSDAYEEHNKFKRITTRNGMSVTFVDEEKGEGEKDKLVIETAKKMFNMTFDNEDKKITIIDKDKKNKIEFMSGDDGHLAITMEKKCTIKIGDTIVLKMNGENGTVSLKCDKFTMESSKDVTVKSDTIMKTEAAEIGVKANNSLTLESSGTTTLKGQSIKLG